MPELTQSGTGMFSGLAPVWFFCYRLLEKMPSIYICLVPARLLLSPS